jgi:hypothetical protein
MMIIAFRWVETALPWSKPNRDYTKNVVVCCETEMSGRRLAATQCGEETPEAWLVPGSVRVEVYATDASYPVECVILSDA